MNKTIKGFDPQISIGAGDLVPFWKDSTNKTSHITYNLFISSLLASIVVQSAGSATNKVMSQKAVTDELLAMDADISALEAKDIELEADIAEAIVTANGYTDTQNALNEKLSNKNTANGYAGLDAGGKVAAAQLPSFVDDVIEVADYASLPLSGETGKIYVLATPYESGGFTSTQYRWSGSAYVPIVASPGTSDALSEGAVNKYYTDARSAENVKVNGSSPDTTANIKAGNNFGFKWGAGINDPVLRGHAGSGYVEIKVPEFVRIYSTKNTNEILRLMNFNGWYTTIYKNGIGNNDVTLPSNSGILALTTEVAALALATVLSSFTVGSATTIVDTDTLLVALGKVQSQINANVTALGTKITVNGDSPASTLRIGTNNAQSLILETNNVDRVTIDASGNVTQAGTATFWNMVIPRIRNTVGGFFAFISNTVAGRLDFGGDFTEINFTKPITNIKGTGNRMVETNAAGEPTAVEAIVSLFIYNVTVHALLSDADNWHKVTGDYIGTSLASYDLEQGQYYKDADYFYYMHSTTVPLRIAFSNSIAKDKAVFVTATANVEDYTERFFFVNGAFNFTLPDAADYEFVELTFKNISAADTCTLIGQVDLTTDPTIPPLAFIKIKSTGAGWYKIG